LSKAVLRLILIRQDGLITLSKGCHFKQAILFPADVRRLSYQRQSGAVELRGLSLSGSQCDADSRQLRAVDL